MKNKYAEIQNTKANIDTNDNWSEVKFSHPERTIRLATSFSGIGAIEHAFHRLGLNVNIQFAGDIDEDCKKAYLQTMISLMTNGIRTYMILMPSHLKGRWTYLWEELHVKPFL